MRSSAGQTGVRGLGGTITTRRLRNNTPRASAVNCLATIATNKKGRPESRPLPSPLRTDARRWGIQQLSPFKAGPKDLQRGGCTTMALRINAVNPAAFGASSRTNAGRSGRSVSAAESRSLPPFTLSLEFNWPGRFDIRGRHARANLKELREQLVIYINEN